MFTIVFYIFSSFLAFLDYKKFLIPNNILLAMSVMLITFGLLESKIYISSIILSLLVLLFFVVILLLNRTQILGGGDIKYMMVIALYLGVKPFAVFLVVTGLVQTFALLYKQMLMKRRVAPMAPAMFISVAIVDMMIYFKIYPSLF
ncbi:prepilin peptidase [Arcobacter sp. F155]|uniref:prepilin peptidase n=1 Tax=Arcobacter sp. F155 TaxID=2044512 RepID=UPI0013E9359A|nr:prepilin peptidase [Arcobacter sp. F155]